MDSKELPIEINLKQYWLTLKQRWLIALLVFGAVTSLAALVAATQKKVYQADAQLWFQTSRSPILTGLNKDVSIGRLEALTLQNNPLDTQAEIVRSVPVLEEVIKSLNLTSSPQVLARQLEVKGVVGTDVLKVSYKSSDPKLAATVVNKVIEVYIRSNILSNRAEAVSARQFIQSQLPKAEVALAQADSDLRRFRENNSVILLEEEAKEAVKTIATIDQQIATSRGQFADTAARSQQLKRQVGLNSQQAIYFTALSQSQGVREVLTALQAAQTQLTVQKSRYVAGPPIDSLERKVSSLTALLQERISQISNNNEAVSAGNLQIGELQATLIADFVRSEAEMQGIGQRVAELGATRLRFEQQMKRLPQLDQTQREMERKVKATQTTYETLLSTLQEVQLAENQTIGNARIISPAQIPEQGTSKSNLILAAGVLAGILLGIATVFFVDLLDQSIKNLQQAKARFGYAVLGMIPLHYHSKQNAPEKDGRSNLVKNELPRVIVRDEPQSLAAEAYQMLQANVKFLSADRTLKTIVVTSSVPQEGKSEVAANLAAAIAQVGRRVLLVDADMRCPTQHLIWKLDDTTGLSQLIANRVALDEVIREVVPNLWVLAAGESPPNSLALLDSTRMVSLIDEFSSHYDVILFDTPPLAGIADAAVLGKMVDGLLLVVRPGLVDSSGAIAVREFLSRSNQDVLGMVVNGVDSKSDSDTRFYYNVSYQNKRTQTKMTLSPEEKKVLRM